MDKTLSVTGESFQPQQHAVAVCHGYENLPQEFRYSWYWNKKVIENCSPSRADGIDLAKESQLRMLYCSFIQDIGMMLRVPQVTIATAIMFCHRFYLHQSHAKNEWQTIATVCMFLASKVEDTPCHLNKVVKIAYETMYQRDYVAAQRINKTEVFEKQKSLILLAERLVLRTIRYDFNVRHPYKPLVEGLRKLKIDKKNVRQTAWNFVNDWLRTTICLQFEPNYIAAGSIFLSAKHHNVKLSPGDDGCTWWQVLNVVPFKFDAVLRQMKEVLSSKQKQAPKLPPKPQKQTETTVIAVVKQETVLSPDSCVSTEDVHLASKSTTSSAKFSVKSENSEGPNGTHKNSMEDVTSVPESRTSDAKLSPKDHFEAGNSQGNAKDECEKGNSEGVNCTVKNHMDRMSSDPVFTTSNAKLNGNSEGLNGTVKNYIEDVSLVPEPTTCNAELSKKNPRETGNSEGFNGTVKNCMDDMPSIPESTTSNAETCTKIQRETRNSEGLNGNCMEDDMPSIPEPVISTPKVSAENQCGAKESNRVDGTVKCGLENAVQNGLKSLLDVDKIKSLMNRRKRNRNIGDRAISLENLNDDEWIERELERGIVLAKRPKPCKNLVCL